MKKCPYRGITDILKKEITKTHAECNEFHIILRRGGLFNANLKFSRHREFVEQPDHKIIPINKSHQNSNPMNKSCLANLFDL